MNENVNVCITPKGEKPVLHFSQYDNERVFTVTVLADDGESAAVLTGLDIEFRIRKTDSHVVTIAPESVADNVITFKTTEQMCACCGQNIASVVLMKDDMIISTLDILVDIQRDILSGGLTSESDIRNLTTQIEQIVPEVVGDDYYNKQEVDDLITEHTFDPSNYYDKNYINTMYWTAQQIDQLFYRKTYINDNYYTKDDVYTKSDVYNKTETDNLLSEKADRDDLAEVATTGDYDDLLNKPSLSAVATSGSYNDLTDKPYIPNTYSTTEEQIIGTWIDGRPIYRKVVVWDDNLPSQSGWQTLISVPNVEAVINSRTIVDENTGGRRYGTRDMYLVEAAPIYNNIQIYNASPYGVYVKWVIVEYVKTA